MMKIGYMCGFWWTEGLPEATDIPLQNSLHISQEAAAEFRKRLSIPPGLPAEQVEWTRIEARLEAACDNGSIKSNGPLRGFKACSGPLGYRYELIAPNPQGDWQTGQHPTRLAAAQAALVYVETLEAAAQLPEPEAMDWSQCLCEIVLSGAELVRGQYGPEVRRPGKSVMYNAYTIDGLRSAVRYLRHAARDLDAQA